MMEHGEAYGDGGRGEHAEVISQQVATTVHPARTATRRRLGAAAPTRAPAESQPEPDLDSGSGAARPKRTPASAQPEGRSGAMTA
jgi:hypothetical protein